MTVVGYIIENKNSKCVEWRIADFFTLSENNSVYHSPNFVFAGGSWRLEIYPNGKPKKSEGHVVVSLMRYSRTPRLCLRYSLALKTVDGKIFVERDLMHIFRRLGRNRGVEFFKRSELYARRSELVPTDVLYVVCKFKYVRFTDVENEGCKCVPSTSRDAVLDDFRELFLKQEGCDVAIRVDGEEVLAHKAILRARAPALLSQLRIDRRKKKKAPAFLHVEGIKSSSLKDFLHFLYCGKVEDLSKENVFDLFDVAYKYNVPDLKEECMLFLGSNMSIDTFFDVADISKKTQEYNLAVLVSDFFAHNAKEIIETDKWVKFQKQNPKWSNELFLFALSFAGRS